MACCIIQHARPAAGQSVPSSIGSLCCANEDTTGIAAAALLRSSPLLSLTTRHSPGPAKHEHERALGQRLTPKSLPWQVQDMRRSVSSQPEGESSRRTWPRWPWRAFERTACWGKASPLLAPKPGPSLRCGPCLCESSCPQPGKSALPVAYSWLRQGQACPSAASWPYLMRLAVDLSDVSIRFNHHIKSLQ